MKVLISKGVTNPRGKMLDMGWMEFVEFVQRHSIPRSIDSKDEKREAPWFSPARYKGDYRNRENLIGKVHMLCADLDGILNASAIRRAFEKWEYLAWTTWSSTAESPRWRVVFPIEGGVRPERFAALARRILDPVRGHAKVDERSYLPEQLWFLPWHRELNQDHHRVWRHPGKYIRDAENLIHLDFTGVVMANKPEEIGEGGRNNALVVRLSEPDAMRCENQEDLYALAQAWNKRLKHPLPSKEVRGVVRKKWRWMQRGEGVVRRAEAWKGRLELDDIPDVGVGLLSDAIKTASLPPSLVGDFLYPGATMISAKMKEGKSFLAMQLAISIAAGSPFLAGPTHPGFSVLKRQRAVVIAGEDTAGGISARFMGSIAAGYLPKLPDPEDVLIVFNDDLDAVKKAQPKVPGLALFEALVERWYSRGYRIIALDPLRVVEAALGIGEYPGCVPGMNAHAKDFQTMRYYTKIAQKHSDLCILVSMHHGKNKRDHDAMDPGDMIAGTTGFGAGAVTTISLLPIDEKLAAEEDIKSGAVAKRRELYIHGRHTREQRVLIEQDLGTGVWKAMGSITDELMNKDRQKYFEVLLNIGGTTRYVSAEEIAKAVGRAKPGTVHKVLSRARRKGNTYLGWQLVIKRGTSGGYRLIESQQRGVKEKMK